MTTLALLTAFSAQNENSDTQAIASNAVSNLSEKVSSAIEKYADAVMRLQNLNQEDVIKCSNATHAYRQWLDTEDDSIAPKLASEIEESAELKATLEAFEQADAAAHSLLDDLGDISTMLASTISSISSILDLDSVIDEDADQDYEEVTSDEEDDGHML